VEFLELFGAVAGGVVVGNIVFSEILVFFAKREQKKKTDTLVDMLRKAKEEGKL
jgi:hypothetical protein